jgi:hypothetical protein
MRWSIFLSAKTVEVEVKTHLPKVAIGRLAFTSQFSGRTCPGSKPDSAADWLARRVDHASKTIFWRPQFATPWA